MIIAHVPCRKQLQKLRRQRMWQTLVAEVVEEHEQETSLGHSKREIIGYIAVSLKQPLAILPPPFPSASPLYLHIDGLAVLPGHRRKGVGKALLHNAERLGQFFNSSFSSK